MMSRTLKTTLAVAAAAVLIPGVAAAQMGDRLTQRDFERCHVQAMQVAGVRVESPAASPGMTGPSGTVAPHGTATQPGTSAVVTPPATSPVASRTYWAADRGGRAPAATAVTSPMTWP